MPRIEVGEHVDRFISWLLRTVPGLFDAISEVMTSLVNTITKALVGPPFAVWVVVFALAAVLVRGWAFGVFTVLAFVLVQSLELWQETMETLGLVIVAGVIAAAIGVPLGVWAARRRTVRVVLRPVLDFMQTTPVFVYLIPAVFFFGIGVVPGVVATTIFAIPPAVRLTDLGIRQVDPEVVEAAHAFGARPRQILREVQLPMATPSIMAGLNQVIMLALSMVVVAGLAGAAGLGAVVVTAVTQLDVAAGFEGGLAVVILAIFLDRLTATLAERTNRGLWHKLIGRRRRKARALADERADTPRGSGGAERQDESSVPVSGEKMRGLGRLMRRKGASHA